MPTSRTRLRLVLLQIRDERTSLIHEQRCFIERCRVARSQFTFINLAEQPNVRWHHVESAHAVLIGGAGGYSVTAPQPFSKPLEQVVLRLVEDHRPVFGSCWGHQFLAALFGGVVEEDAERAEVGSFPIRLTETGKADPLFADFPERFHVQLGHNDLVTVLGPLWHELAASDRCRFQAIRMAGRPVYGTQFHSELDEYRIRERLDVYREAYAPDPDTYEKIVRTLRPSVWADGLMARFLELYA